MRNLLLTLFLVGQLSSCQSARTAVVPAGTGAYNTPPPPIASAPASVLTAELPTETAPTATPQAKLGGVARPTPSVAAPPDTLLRPPSLTDFKPDVPTTVINVVGAAVAVTGVAMMIEGTTSGPPQTEWGGLSRAIQAISGCVLLGVGVGLVFFQGRNGRHRLLKQALKTGSIPPPTAPTPGPSQSAAQDPVTVQRRSRRRKAGGFLMLSGLVLTIAGLLLSVVLIPIGVLLSLIGLVCYVAGS